MVMNKIVTAVRRIINTQITTVSITTNKFKGKSITNTTTSTGKQNKTKH